MTAADSAGILLSDAARLRQQAAILIAEAQRLEAQARLIGSDDESDAS